MKSTVLMFVFLGLAFAPVSAQEDAKDLIVAQGKKLFYSEMTSWYGSDVFMEKFKDRSSEFRGYFSYSKDDKFVCVFYGPGPQPKTVATITLDSSFSVKTAIASGERRDLNAVELAYSRLRDSAVANINGDTLFRHYNNTRLNLVPIIDDDGYRVYVLTGPQVDSVVVLGNDYMLEFNSQFRCLRKERLHRNIIPIDFAKPGQNVEASMHSHLETTGPFITPTDICTLMLYGKFAGWKQHIVMSRTHVSIWDCNKNSLVLLTREAWERIQKN